MKEIDCWRTAVLAMKYLRFLYLIACLSQRPLGTLSCLFATFHRHLAKKRNVPKRPRSKEKIVRSISKVSTSSMSHVWSSQPTVLSLMKASPATSSKALTNSSSRARSNASSVMILPIRSPRLIAIDHFFEDRRRWRQRGENVKNKIWRWYQVVILFQVVIKHVTLISSARKNRCRISFYSSYDDRWNDQVVSFAKT